MTEQQPTDWFRDIDTIVSQPLNFKARLAIGEEAYTALKVKNAVVQAWDVAGVATTAAVVAKSSVVASTFFAPTGFLAAIGIGTAVTPIGWVITAGVVTGGAWFGITRHLKKTTASKVTVVPNFINTPLDVLALGLFDLLAPLALKIAETNAEIDDSRRIKIKNYFIVEWGYDSDFIDEGIRYVESKLDEVSVQSLAKTMAEFTRQNRDCNFTLMSQEILGFLRDMVSVDGHIRATDQEEIDRIETVFKSARRSAFRKRIHKGLSSLKKWVKAPFKSRKSS
jgi:hypothetical protein